MKQSSQIVNPVEKNTSVSSSTATIEFNSPVYYELGDQTIINEDITLQLRKNLEQVAEMQQKLQFLMREIKYMMKL